MRGLRQSVIDDLDLVYDLMVACEDNDLTGAAPRLDVLKHLVATPGLDVLRHTFVVPGEEGQLVACCGGLPFPAQGGLDVQCILMVRPDHRVGGLEDDLLRFIEVKTRAFLEEVGKAGVLRAYLRPHQRHLEELYARHGFVPGRRFVVLRRDLTVPIDEPAYPDGVSARLMGPRSDVGAYRFVLEDSFRDHWNPQEISRELAKHMVEGPRFLPSLTLLAFGPGDEPAGFCTGTIPKEGTAQALAREGTVNLLGVRRRFRRRGLARALMNQGFRLLRDEGMVGALINVDSENPLGAATLYESLGCIATGGATVVHEKPMATRADG